MGIAKSSAKVADIGSSSKSGLGYDSNAWFFESVNAANMIRKWVTHGPWGIVNLIRDIVRYF